ncbi:peptidase inhibitor i9 protein [Pyrenophora tritici-repentis]|nr:peptidase inhibitor i9 protein [Pyrenophora tritici-repentis]KAI1540447.1 peptidase inhibitor i9 protein [Pyrenophora tritici-repentis]KAI1552314.1 peptidase inhibitor i9 protein [Pyrenophora tritici-repentis]KAI1564407.1 peptidase inhibitor i9 protein [Pyrenophora tritici-repentis]KAI1581930.1 peptidase inhibitor i9 protein [Pyrenophora tritici-repentis]
MAQFNITLKKDAPQEQLDAAKKHVTDQGGKIVNEFTLIKGFTAEIPDDAVTTLESNEHVTVEKDAEIQM